MKQLGINPAMDKLSRDNGLGHWSCVSPLDTDLWVRSDGKSTCYAPDWGKSLTQWLTEFDKTYPIGTDWQQPTTDLPEKILVSNGCHDCIFEADRSNVWICLLNRNLSIEKYGQQQQQHPECSLLTHTIKVVKNG